MSVNETMLGRVKKLLRVTFQIKTGSVTDETALGGSPIGFDGAFIDSEFRIALNKWFADLIPAFPAVSWDEDTAIAEVISDILGRSKIQNINTIAVYRTHIRELAQDAFDQAAGANAQNVPVASRPAVQRAMNDDLESSLLTDISLSDLAGNRATILSNITDRMVI